MKNVVLVGALVAVMGCETFEGSADQYLTRGPDGEPAVVEQVVETGQWFLPSPYRELVVGVTSSVVAFWAARRRSQKNGSTPQDVK